MRRTKVSFARRSSSLSLSFVVVVALVAAVAAASTASSPPPAANSSASSSSARPWSPKDFPDPTQDPQACGRPSGRPSWICDPDGIVPSKSATDEIEGVLRDIALARKPFAASPCASRGEEARGYQVALALMSRLDLSSSASPGDAAAGFAARVMDKWGVGRGGGCDDGVVVLLSEEDRQSYILAGRGALPSLPQSTSSRILDAARPLLRSGDVGGALKQIAVDVGLSLAGAPPPPRPRGGLLRISWGTLFFFAVVAAIVYSSARQASRERAQARAAREALEKIRQQQAAAEAAAARAAAGGGGAAPPSPFASASCPVCLEDFTPAGEEADGDEEEAGGGSAPSAPLLPIPGFLSTRQQTTTAAPPRRKRVVRPLTMRCGHCFCDECITKWSESGKDTCPICRAPLSGPAPTAATSTTSTSTTTSPPPATTANTTSWHRDELAFRLGSLHRLYPAVVTAEILSEWLGQARTGSALTSWEGVRSAQLAGGGRVSSRRRHEGARYGAVSSGFGGGSSAGGGGAGGTW